MDGVGGGFVGTEFQLRFDVQGSDDIRPSIQCRSFGVLERNLVRSPVHSNRQDHQVFGERGLVAGNWDCDFLRYLYCMGFCDSPLPEYDLH